MIADTSALVAILRDELEAAACPEAIEAARHRRMSAANFVEAAIVNDGSLDPVASRRSSKRRNWASKRRPSSTQGSRAEPIATSAAAAATRRGWIFGDCFAYALARAKGEPFLFTGNDFSYTTLRLH